LKTMLAASPHEIGDPFLVKLVPVPEPRDLLLERPLLANSLCRAPEKRTMRESEV
jgi:hypothetical protein